MEIKRKAILFTVLLLLTVIPAQALGSANIRIEQAYASMPQIEAVVFADGCTEENITAALDGTAIEVTQITDVSAYPTDYYFVLDISGSIDKKDFESIKAGLKEWQEKLGVRDRLMLVTFGSEVNTVLNGKESSRSAAAKIDELKASDKKTRLFDGVSEALKIAEADREQSENRRILLLITDGRDFSDGGSTTKNEINKLLDKSKLPLYAFGLGKNKDSLDVLGEMARSNNGGYYAASGDVAAVMSGAFKEINNAKLIRLDTGSNIADGKDKRLELKCGGAAAEMTIRTDKWIADTLPPVAESAKFNGDTSVSIQFSEPVSGADNAANFTLLDKNGQIVGITGASYDEGTHTAVLSLAKALPNGKYTLGIIHVQDVSMERNPLAKSEYALEMTEGRTVILGISAIWFYLILAAAVISIAAAIIAAAAKRERLRNASEDNILPENVPGMNNKRNVVINNKGRYIRLIIIDKGGAQSAVQAFVNTAGCIIGRSSGQEAGADINIVGDGFISRRQCRLIYRDGAVLISNLSDTNITRLNGRAIPSGEYRLENGDHIEIGQTRIVVSMKLNDMDTV